ncbi:MAG: CBS domain-containing protein [Methermicoccaceae archaeon]
MDSKTRNTFYLLFGAIVYLVAIYAILKGFSNFSRDVTILFALALLPMLAVFVMVWGYGLRLKMRGVELEYYPVEKIMTPPVTIHEDVTGEEAERIMDEKRTDFLNVLDRDGLFRGIFTKADAHDTRLKGKIKGRVRNLMTRGERVIHALEREDLRSVMEKIGKTKHSRLPVLDKNNRLMGVVDAVDINDLLSKILR